MTKHERFDEFKQYIKALARKCRDLTFQGVYQIDFEWSDEPSVATCELFTIFADTTIDPDIALLRENLVAELRGMGVQGIE
ncbi:MAG: hypothetical protein L6Q38_16110 [Nitrospira sp.]|nr:hypothetical protein [Nitrospira sp.]